MVIGGIVGLALHLVGIYSETTWLRIVGALVSTRGGAAD